MQPQRDHLGRYLPGHRGGPGRPKRTRSPAYQIVLEDVISPEEWRAIVKRLKHYILDGDLAALRILAPYLLGRPTTAALQDANDNPSPTPVPSELTGLPAQLSPSMLKELSRQLEREGSRYDEPIDNTMNKHLVLKKRA